MKRVGRYRKRRKEGKGGKGIRKRRIKIEVRKGEALKEGREY